MIIMHQNLCFIRCEHLISRYKTSLFSSKCYLKVYHCLSKVHSYVAKVHSYVAKVNSYAIGMAVFRFRSLIGYWRRWKIIQVCCKSLLKSFFQKKTFTLSQFYKLLDSKGLLWNRRFMLLMDAFIVICLYIVCYGEASRVKLLHIQ